MFRFWSVLLLKYKIFSACGLFDKNSLEIINGSIVNYKKEMIGDSFTIENPKATSSCGCGLSFSV